MPTPNEKRVVHTNAVPWTKIPYEVKQEVDDLGTYTKDTGREGSITMCKKRDKNRLFIGNNFEGDTESTLAGDCDAQFGKSDKIGSVHSHPSNIDVVGILPSEADLTSTVSDSREENIAQLDCITAPDTPLINCYMWKRGIPTQKAVDRYDQALEMSRYKTDPFFYDNVRKDFDIALFDRVTGVREDKPEAKKVIKAAFGKSTNALRQAVNKFERGVYCEYVADLMGQHARDDVVAECREELRKKTFLGFEYE